MLTYTVPFFGYQNGTYFFKGTSGIDIDLRKVDIDQCPIPAGSKFLNIFAASDKCKNTTTYCESIKGYGFRRGSYKCVCRRGFYFANKTNEPDFFNGSVIEEEYEKLMLGEESRYSSPGMFECSPCAEGCEFCVDDKPCILSLNWLLRSFILGFSILIILCLFIVEYFTCKYRNLKVIRAASPLLLRVIVLGAFFIYSTNIVMYPIPSVWTCTLRVWLREIGFSLTYGALMLKTWRISVIFRVRSAKSVKITDTDLLKKLSAILIVFSSFLVTRMLVSPPHAEVVTTADNLKTYLCRTDWWDHYFSIMEGLFLVWGMWLCIVVRKAPSEFNESKFISMAIYNEFLFSLFLNISMLFLHSPANPDLLYIICFCHTQITITLLLCFIFGSKAYMVYKGEGKTINGSHSKIKLPTKFLSKPSFPRISQTFPSSSSLNVSCVTESKLSEQDIQDEFRQLCRQVELLKDKSCHLGNKNFGNKLNIIQDSMRKLSGETDPCDEDFTDNENVPSQFCSVKCSTILGPAESEHQYQLDKSNICSIELKIRNTSINIDNNLIHNNKNISDNSNNNNDTDIDNEKFTNNSKTNNNNIINSNHINLINDQNVERPVSIPEIKVEHLVPSHNIIISVEDDSKYNQILI